VKKDSGEFSVRVLEGKRLTSRQWNYPLKRQKKAGSVRDRGVPGGHGRFHFNCFSGDP
jgi:hypothetical protein